MRKRMLLGLFFVVFVAGVHATDFVMPISIISTPACKGYSQRHLMPESCKMSLPRLTPAEQNNQPSATYRSIFSVLWTSPYTNGRQRGAGSHGGLDIATVRGTPVYAMTTGTVVTASYKPGRGNIVTIVHSVSGEKIFSSYAHLDSIMVAVDDPIVQGQQIGTVGDTGTATAPHLHFQIDRDMGQKIPYGFSLCPEAFGKDVFTIVNNALCADLVRSFTIDPVLFLTDATLASSRIRLFDQEFATFDQAYQFFINRGTNPDTITDIFGSTPVLELPSVLEIDQFLLTSLQGLQQGIEYTIRTNTKILDVFPRTVYGTDTVLSLQRTTKNPGLTQVSVVDSQGRIQWQQNVLVGGGSPPTKPTISSSGCSPRAYDHPDDNGEQNPRLLCHFDPLWLASYDLVWIPAGGSLFQVYDSNDRLKAQVYHVGIVKHGMRFGGGDLGKIPKALVIYGTGSLMWQER